MNLYDPSRFQQAIDDYRNDRKSCDKAAALRKEIAAYMLDQRAKGTPIAGIGPSLGVLDAVKEQHSHDFNWRGRAFLVLLRVCLRPNRPGWNDYWMARWMCTHNLSCVRQMHVRAAGHTCTRWPHVVESAAWMVRSTRQHDPIFDSQMKQVEQDCGLCNPQIPPSYPAA